MREPCVCRGGYVPEGYGHVCPNCSNYNMIATVQTNVSTNIGDLEVSFSFGNNPCFSIKNSYKITKGKEILKLLEQIHGMFEYKRLQNAGYTRTLKSEYREWKGHNFLYRLGIAKDRTGSVDIDQNEPKLQRFVYAILSIF